MTAILGRKVGMTQVFDDRGNVVPVTVIEAGPCVVTEVRTPDRDGYAAVQVGFGAIPDRKVNKPLRGVFARAKTGPRRVLREFRLPDGERYEVGQELTVTGFGGGDVVDVVGTSKGRGYSGVMKRHNFSGQRATHGVKKVHRHPGSTGMSAFPSRVFKGRRMAGQYGNVNVTARNLKVVRVDEEHGLLLVRG